MSNERMARILQETQKRTPSAGVAAVKELTVRKEIPFDRYKSE